MASYLVNYKHDRIFHRIWIMYEIMYFKCDKMKLQTAHVKKNLKDRAETFMANCDTIGKKTDLILKNNVPQIFKGRRYSPLCSDQ